MKNEQTYQPAESYMRVATACPEVIVANVAENVRAIDALYQQAAADNTSLVTFPELSLTGYTVGDLVQQNQLLEDAKQGLQTLATATADKPTAMVVGLPLQVRNRLYNCAAVLADGDIKGIVPKSNLPTYNEFYEDRWFDTWDEETTEVELDGKATPFGTDILFNIDGTLAGVEICEDLWVDQPPSGQLAAKGAVLIANPSASPEQVGKDDYRRMLVAGQSGRLVAGYLYAGCDTSESTAEIVMGGHQIIAANAQILAERKPFGSERLLTTDIDIEQLKADRRKQHAAQVSGALVVETTVARQQEDLRAPVERNPFLPKEGYEQRKERLDAILEIQAQGLAQRMRATHQDRLVLGLSGGLDSTLALLVARKAADILERDPANMIHTLTMPGPASSKNTQDNAGMLAKDLGVSNVVMPIVDVVEQELEGLGHDGTTQDVTFENVQARARTNRLFNYGNQHNAMVLGTGDLSEIALGWCTYNADQQSHYNVNASIPKTVVKELVKHVIEQAEYDNTEPEYRRAQETLERILHTTISPELTKQNKGEISQSTEDIIGPYELHDFFLYHLVRFGDNTRKIAYLANQAFEGDYDQETIDTWLGVFCKRFATNQFKRDTNPNGPKVGSVSLSPRGDWRMPADLYNAGLWR